MVITWTASASDSRRRARSSLSPSRSTSWIRRPSQVARAVGPNPSDTPASWRSWATWRRSVMKRSPDARVRTRRGTSCELLTLSNSAAIPWSRSSAAQRCRDQCRPSHDSSDAVASSFAVQPTKQVNATSAARSRAVGRSKASRRRSHSLAGSVANTEPEPPITAGTLTAWSASRTSAACELSRTSTAMWPGCTSTCPRSRPSRPRSMSFGRAERNATTSAARSPAIAFRASSFFSNPCLGVTGTSPSAACTTRSRSGAGSGASTRRDRWLASAARMGR